MSTFYLTRTTENLLNYNFLLCLFKFFLFNSKIKQICWIPLCNIWKKIVCWNSIFVKSLRMQISEICAFPPARDASYQDTIDLSHEFRKGWKIHDVFYNFNTNIFEANLLILHLCAVCIRVPVLLRPQVLGLWPRQTLAWPLHPGKHDGLGKHYLAPPNLDSSKLNQKIWIQAEFVLCER